MASGIDYANLPQDKKLATQALDIEKNDKELERKLGSLGKLFGYGNNVVLYIIALITIFLVLIAAIYSFIPLNETLYKSRAPYPGRPLLEKTRTLSPEIKGNISS